MDRKIGDAIEIGTRECALCTLVNIERIRDDLKEIRKHVRSADKHRIDNANAILKIIAFETRKTFAISNIETEAFIKKFSVPTNY